MKRNQKQSSSQRFSKNPIDPNKNTSKDNIVDKFNQQNPNTIPPDQQDNNIKSQYHQTTIGFQVIMYQQSIS